jgi:hypothetical protein
MFVVSLQILLYNNKLKLSRRGIHAHCHSCRLLLPVQEVSLGGVKVAQTSSDKFRLGFNFSVGSSFVGSYKFCSCTTFSPNFFMSGKLCQVGAADLT